MVGKLGSKGYLVVIRLSPFIPGYSLTSEDEVESAIGVFKDLGVKHVIVEALRVMREFAEKLAESLGLKGLEFEAYSIREVNGALLIVRVSWRQRAGVYSLLYKHTVRYGIDFATCKEGAFKYHTTDDCCGAYLLKANYGSRIALWDFYRAKIDHSIVNEEVLSKVARNLTGYVENS